MSISYTGNLIRLFPTYFVKLTLVFPSIALAAEFLLDPFNYSMTIFISELSFPTFFLAFETLALAFFAVPL